MRWFLGSLLILVLGTILQLGFLVYAMYVLLGILLLSRFVTRQWSDGIKATRSPTSGKAEIGDRRTITIEIVNQSVLAVPWLIFEESFPRKALQQVPQKLTLKGKGKGIGITKLSPNATHEVQYTVTFHQRGYYQLGPLLVETGDLFGLHRQFKVLTEPQFILVPPRMIPLSHYQIESRRPIGEIRIAHRLFEDPTRIAAVRPYQPGDPLNQIHWRATARTGELHSRIYENSCVAGATLLLDFHEHAYEGSGAERSAELAIITAASFANALFEEGQQIGFLSNGRDAAERIKTEGWQGEFTTRENAQTRVQRTQSNERFRPISVPTEKGADRLDRILEALARLEPGTGLDFAGLVQEAVHLLPRDATVLPILRDASPSSALALGMLKRRGFAVTVIFVQFDEGYSPDWAKAPSWAEPILAQGLDFITISSEKDLGQLSTLALLP